MVARYGDYKGILLITKSVRPLRFGLRLLKVWGRLYIISFYTMIFTCILYDLIFCYIILFGGSGLMTIEGFKGPEYEAKGVKGFCLDGCVRVAKKGRQGPRSVLLSVGL